MNKLIVILGPTASGKSALAVKIALRLGSGQALRLRPAKAGLRSGQAQKFGGAEIISADSRQVYKGMNIGTGKITKKEMQGVPHYLLDVASPKRRFTVAQYQKKALEAVKRIYGSTGSPQVKKIPILCGGTGFYIQAIVDGLVIPKVKPDFKLRAELEKMPTEKLFEKLKKLDQKRAKTIDRHNRRRLIRALEIVIKTGQPIPELKTRPAFDILMLGVKKSKEELKILIKKRLLKRLNQGLIKEVKKLRNSGISWRRLEEFGLEYRWVAYYLQNKISYQEMVKTLQKKIEQYAKRQMTWFSAHGGSASGGKRDKRIKWITDSEQAFSLIRAFL